MISKKMNQLEISMVGVKKLRKVSMYFNRILQPTDYIIELKENTSESCFKEPCYCVTAFYQINH